MAQLFWTRGHCTAGPPIDPLNVHLCWYMLYKGSWCTAGLCSAWHSVELCGVESCALPPPKPLNPSVQATSGLVYQQPFRGMDLDEAHQDALYIAKSVISGCWTMLVSIAIYFRTSLLFLWKTPKISCLLSIDSYYLLRLINLNMQWNKSFCMRSPYCLGCIANNSNHLLPVKIKFSRLENDLTFKEKDIFTFLRKQRLVRQNLKLRKVDECFSFFSHFQHNYLKSFQK